MTEESQRALDLADRFWDRLLEFAPLVGTEAGDERFDVPIISRDDAHGTGREYGSHMAIRSWIDRWGDWALTILLMAGIARCVRVMNLLL